MITLFPLNPFAVAAPQDESVGVPAAAPVGRTGEEFRVTVLCAWQLARAGLYDEGLAVIAEARRRVTSEEQAAKLEAMATTFRTIQQAAGTRGGPAIVGVPRIPVRPGEVQPPPQLTPPQPVRPIQRPTDVRVTPRQPARPTQRPTEPVVKPTEQEPVPRPTQPAEVVDTVEQEGGEPGDERRSWAERILTYPMKHIPVPPMPHMPEWGELFTAQPELETDAWEFSFGLNWRDGGSVEFDEIALKRPDGGQFVNGRFTDGQNFNIEGFEGDPANELVPPSLSESPWMTINGTTTRYVRSVSFDRASYGGGGDDMEDLRGLSFQARKPLAKDRWHFSSLVLGLSVGHNETDVTVHTGSGVNSETMTGFLWKEGGATPTDQEPVTPYEVVGGRNVLGGAAPYTMSDVLQQRQGAGVTDVQLDLTAETLLFTLKAGGERDYPITTWCDLILGGGATVSVAHFSTEVAQSATWDAPGNPLDGTKIPGFQDSDTDSTTEFLLGAYAGVGIRIQLIEHLALDISYQYNATLFGDAATDHAELDLGDGWGGEIRFTLDF